MGNGSAVRTERGRDRGRRARERGRPAGGRASLTRAPCRQVNPPARPGPAGSAAGLRGGGPVLEGEAAVPGPAPCGRPGRAGLGGCGAADGGPASPPGRERPPRPPARRPGGGRPRRGLPLGRARPERAPVPRRRLCGSALPPRGAAGRGGGRGRVLPRVLPLAGGEGVVRCDAARCGAASPAGPVISPQCVLSQFHFCFGGERTFPLPPPSPPPRPGGGGRGEWSPPAAAGPGGGIGDTGGGGGGGDGGGGGGRRRCRRVWRGDFCPWLFARR